MKKFWVFIMLLFSPAVSLAATNISNYASFNPATFNPTHDASITLEKTFEGAGSYKMFYDGIAYHYNKPESGEFEVSGGVDNELRYWKVSSEMVTDQSNNNRIRTQYFRLRKYKVSGGGLVSFSIPYRVERKASTISDENLKSYSEVFILLKKNGEQVDRKIAITLPAYISNQSERNDLKEGVFEVVADVSDGDMLEVTAQLANDITVLSATPIQQNTPPVANAGQDLAVSQVGETICLDGKQSYDVDSDPLTYSWQLIEKPIESSTYLENNLSSSTCFTVDSHGDYILELTVSDGLEASKDSVAVTFSNVPPIAVAGNNQTVVQGDLVCFDGSGSSDANLDVLSYTWEIATKPVESTASFDDPTYVEPCFIADLPGSYDVELFVNDGFDLSEPSYASVLAVSFLDAVSLTVQNSIEAINGLNPEVFKNKNMQNALTNKINSTLELIVQGAYSDAVDKLQNDILTKTDGCTESGAPDKNDWIEECGSQSQIYSFVIEMIGYAEDML